MVYFIYSIVVFISTFFGAILGFGGGLVIKPVLDTISLHDIVNISYFSSISVFSMTSVSVLKNIFHHKVNYNFKHLIPLSVGAIFGGILGQMLFTYIVTSLSSPDLFQNILLDIILIIILYTVIKNRKLKKKNHNAFLYLATGLILGTISAFLGIGGGPLNVAVFTLVLHMPIKEAAISSIFMKLFPMASKLLLILLSGKVTHYDNLFLLVIVPAAILGGFLGSDIHKKLTPRQAHMGYLGLLVFLILLTTFNIVN